MKRMNTNLVLAFAALVSILAALFLGSTVIPADRFFAAVFGAGDIGDRIVLWEIRMPRAIAAFVVGGALGFKRCGLARLVAQSSRRARRIGRFRKRFPLRDLGALLRCGLRDASYSTLGGNHWRYVSDIFSDRRRHAGFFCCHVDPYRRRAIKFRWRTDGFAAQPRAQPFYSFRFDQLVFRVCRQSHPNRSLNDLYFAAPFFIAGLFFLFSSARSLSALTLGEEAAHSLGADLKKTRMFIVIGSGLLTGAAVSIAGAIGFVGIVAPHLVRPFVGYDPARTLTPAALLGGVMLVLADIGVRLIPTPSELRLGVVAALIGAPVFAWIALKRRPGHG